MIKQNIYVYYIKEKSFILKNFTILFNVFFLLIFFLR